MISAVCQCITSAMALLCSLAGSITFPFFLSFLTLRDIPPSITDTSEMAARNKRYGPEAIRTSVISDYINFSRCQVRPLASLEMFFNWLSPHPYPDNRCTVAWMQDICICISAISPVVSSQPSAVRCHLWAVSQTLSHLILPACLVGPQLLLPCKTTLRCQASLSSPSTLESSV